MKRFAVLAKSMADLLGLKLSIPEEEEQILGVMERAIVSEIDFLGQQEPQETSNRPQISRSDE